MALRPAIPVTRDAAMKAFAKVQASARADHEHEAACRATEAGQQAHALRQQGHELARRGQDRAAMALMQQAVGCFAADEDSVGRAAALHDLATAMDSPVAHPATKVAVVELLEQAVASPARQQFPRRWAISASMLSKTLRALAGHTNDAAHAAEMIARAERLVRQAIERAEEFCDWTSAADYWFNLGNLLSDRDGPGAALSAYERAFEWTRPFQDGPEFLERPTLHRLLVNLAQAVRQRDRAGDRKRSRSLMERVVKLDSPEANVARLAIAEWHFSEGKPAKAREVLAGVDFLDLGMLRIDLAVDAFERAGLVDEAVARLRRLMDRLFAERATTVADDRADVSVDRLQECAQVLAALLVRRGSILDAFLALDSVSALRFGEAIKRFALDLRDPITRGLWRQFDEHGTTAAHLETFLDELQVVPNDGWTPAATEALRHLDELDHPDAHVLAGTASALRAALTSGPLDVGALHGACEQATAQARRARFALASRDPSHALTDGPFATDLDAVELATIIPADTVLLRIDVVAGALRTIAVRLDHGQLDARHASVDLPPRLFASLHAYAEGREDERAVLASELTLALATLDIGLCLGDTRVSHVVVLPNAHAARLPLAAIGPAGRRLLDLCDDITWLPSLIALRSRQASHRPRQGQATIAPQAFGRTTWHALALQHSVPEERCFIDRLATVEMVLRQAPKADVVAFYAHGRYIDSRRALEHDGDDDLDDDDGDDQAPGASLELADGESMPLHALTDQWAGVERVELWCCESGVNLPMAPLGLVVDEAFGFDYEFLRVGARSAIGSLYAVLELPTAVIMDHYRRRLTEGVTAPRALADAQRYWISTAMPEIAAHLRENRTLGLARYAEARGIKPPRTRALDAETFTRLYGSPLAWAPFRFVGVCERRPLAAWDPAWDSPLTEVEHDEVARLMARARIPPSI
jgi:tetratricopeptide (TPR) repeat protein